MATLDELATLYGDGDLINKISAALIIEAQNLIELPSPTVPQKAYAAKVFANPKAEAARVLKSLLAVNAALTVAAIQGATDASIQSQVAAVVPTFVDVDAGV